MGIRAFSDSRKLKTILITHKGALYEKEKRTHLRKKRF
jgi:hypothetical protein